MIRNVKINDFLLVFAINFLYLRILYWLKLIIVNIIF